MKFCSYQREAESKDKFIDQTANHRIGFSSIDMCKIPLFIALTMVSCMLPKLFCQKSVNGSQAVNLNYFTWLYYSAPSMILIISQCESKYFYIKCFYIIQTFIYLNKALLIFSHNIYSTFRKLSFQKFLLAINKNYCFQIS